MGIDGFLFTSPVMRVLERSMDLNAKRVEVSASNLSNIDTPKYKALEVDFKGVFDNEVERIDPETPVATNPRHMGAIQGEEGSTPFRIEEQENGAKRVDGNTVDMDVEMSNLAQAQLQYYASVTAMGRKLNMLANAISNKIS